MKRVSALSAMAVAVGLLVSASAHAGLEIDNATPSSAPSQAQGDVVIAPSHVVQATSVSQGTLIQEGTPLAATPVKGWGDDVTLLTALKQVVPDGWRARRVGNVDTDQHVSWKGGKSWVDVLSTLATTYGFTATINWSSHEVILAPATKVVATTKIVTSTPVAMTPAVPAVKELHGNSDVSPDGVRMTTVISMHPIGAPVPVKTWYLSPKLSLRENIEAWAKTAGWTVSWGAADYPIVAGVTLQGDLDSDSGPIATLMKAYQDAEQPLVARVSVANRVIRVENRDYQQSNVSSTNMNTAYPNLRSR